MTGSGTTPTHFGRLSVVGEPDRPRSFSRLQPHAGDLFELEMREGVERLSSAVTFDVQDVTPIAVSMLTSALAAFCRIARKAEWTWVPKGTRRGPRN